MPVLEQVSRFGRVEPGHVRPQVHDRQFAEYFAQSGCMISIRVGEHYMGYANVAAEMRPKVRDEKFTGFRRPAIDHHDLVIG
jgi:hypothetical protein